ncbi:MAG: PHP domain-containing protein [Gemmatimonadota bacterium]
MRIDLHVHSTASDGALPPEAVVRAACDGGLDMIALADHDTTAGVARAAEAAGALVVVPAIEVSTTFGDIDLHILGYFVDPEAPGLLRHERAAAQRREERIRGMLDLLERHGVHVPLDAVRQAAGEAALARPHLARAMVDSDAVRSINDAFETFIGDGGPAFLPTYLPPPADAIRMIHDAGGLAVWAHPPTPLLETRTGEFARLGLDGIECRRPRMTRSETDRALRIAQEHNLLPTGGSDWHGPWSGELGAFFLEPTDIPEFLERGGIDPGPLTDDRRPTTDDHPPTAHGL